jgi:neutral ceramidase
MVKKILKRLFQGLLLLLGLVILFIAISIAPVDRTPAAELDSYATTMKTLEELNFAEHVAKPVNGFSVGYSKINLTPHHKTATAGYGNRRGKLFTSVHDSIYVRTIVVDNGVNRAAIVSADLLIIPPRVTERLESKLQTIGFSLNNTFLGATHTHNSIGNWADGATQFLYGDYDDSIVDFIADKIVESIRAASANVLPSKLRARWVGAPEEVSNRLVDGGPEDSLMRSVEFVRNDSSKLVLLSYTAHATCLYSRDMELSRDYPGVLVDALEEKEYAFAMFMAGAVGSQKASAPTMGWDCVTHVGTKLAEKYLSSAEAFTEVKDSTIVMARIPLSLSDPQVKITPDWKVRSWLFRRSFGEFPVYLTGLRVGDVVLLGTPGDFSGELNLRLDSAANKLGLKSFVTSFNGGYMGYVTPAKYYDVKHYETQLMNWYAPGTGEYIEQCLEKLMLELREIKK